MLRSCAPTCLVRCSLWLSSVTQDKQRGDDRFGYMPLARHFGWALGQLFDVHKAPRVIILEVGALDTQVPSRWPRAFTTRVERRTTWK